MPPPRLALVPGAEQPPCSLLQGLEDQDQAAGRDVGRLVIVGAVLKVFGVELLVRVGDDFAEVVQGAIGGLRAAMDGVTEEAGALGLIGREHPDAALLDVRLRQGDTLEIARALRRRGVPFAVVSGYTRESLPPEMAAAPFLAKPLGEFELVEIARTLFADPVSL